MSGPQKWAYEECGSVEIVSILGRVCGMQKNLGGTGVGKALTLVGLHRITREVMATDPSNQKSRTVCASVIVGICTYQN